MTIMRFIVERGMPFNCMKLGSFRRMFTVIIPPGVPGAPVPKLPTYHMVRTTLLDELDAEVQRCVRPVLDTARQSGCTIMTNGWTNIRSQTLCNYLVGIERGPAYLATDVMRGKKDGPALPKAWLHRLKTLDIQLSDIPAFITDSEGVNVSAMQIFQEDESVKHIFWIPCVTYVMDLILEDIGSIGWVASRIAQARLVGQDATEIMACARSPPWWEDLRRLCKIMDPVMEMLQMLDSDTRQISTVLRRYEIMIASCFTACDSLTTTEQDEILEVFNRRRTMFRTPVHIAAMMLDPEFRDATLSDDDVLQQGLIAALVQFGYPEGSPQHIEVLTSIDKFHARERPFDNATMDKAIRSYNHPSSGRGGRGRGSAGGICPRSSQPGLRDGVEVDLIRFPRQHWDEGEFLYHSSDSDDEDFFCTTMPRGGDDDGRPGDDRPDDDDSDDGVGDSRNRRSLRWGGDTGGRGVVAPRDAGSDGRGLDVVDGGGGSGGPQDEDTGAALEHTCADVAMDVEQHAGVDVVDGGGSRDGQASSPHGSRPHLLRLQHGPKRTQSIADRVRQPHGTLTPTVRPRADESELVPVFEDSMSDGPVDEQHPAPAGSAQETRPVADGAQEDARPVHGTEQDAHPLPRIPVLGGGMDATDVCMEVIEERDLGCSPAPMMDVDQHAEEASGLTGTNVAGVSTMEDGEITPAAGGLGDREVRLSHPIGSLPRTADLLSIGSALDGLPDIRTLISSLLPDVRPPCPDAGSTRATGDEDVGLACPDGSLPRIGDMVGVGTLADSMFGADTIIPPSLPLVSPPGLKGGPARDARDRGFDEFGGDKIFSAMASATPSVFRVGKPHEVALGLADTTTRHEDLPHGWVLHHMRSGGAVGRSSREELMRGGSGPTVPGLAASSFYDQGRAAPVDGGTAARRSACDMTDVPFGTRSISTVGGRHHGAMREYEDQHGRRLATKTSDVAFTRVVKASMSRARSKGGHERSSQHSSRRGTAHTQDEEVAAHGGVPEDGQAGDGDRSRRLSRVHDDSGSAGDERCSLVEEAGRGEKRRGALIIVHDDSSDIPTDGRVVRYAAKLGHNVLDTGGARGGEAGRRPVEGAVRGDGGHGAPDHPLGGGGGDTEEGVIHVDREARGPGEEGIPEHEDVPEFYPDTGKRMKDWRRQAGKEPATEGSSKRKEGGTDPAATPVGKVIEVYGGEWVARHKKAFLRWFYSSGVFFNAFRNQAWKAYQQVLLEQPGSSPRAVLPDHSEIASMRAVETHHAELAEELEEARQPFWVTSFGDGLPASTEYILACRQFEDFHIQRGRFGDWGGAEGHARGRPCSGDGETIECASWWSKFGAGAPQLQRCALRVMHMWSCASLAERNWAVREGIHTKKRNQLTFEKVVQLVEIIANVWLMEYRGVGSSYALPWQQDEGMLDCQAGLDVEVEEGALSTAAVEGGMAPTAVADATVAATVDEIAAVAAAAVMEEMAASPLEEETPAAGGAAAVEGQVAAAGGAAGGAATVEVEGAATVEEEEAPSAAAVEGGVAGPVYEEKAAQAEVPCGGDDERLMQQFLTEELDPVITDLGFEQVVVPPRPPSHFAPQEVRHPLDAEELAREAVRDVTRLDGRIFDQRLEHLAWQAIPSVPWGPASPVSSGSTSTGGRTVGHVPGVSDGVMETAPRTRDMPPLPPRPPVGDPSSSPTGKGSRSPHTPGRSRVRDTTAIQRDVCDTTLFGRIDIDLDSTRCVTEHTGRLLPGLRPRGARTTAAREVPASGCVPQRGRSRGVSTESLEHALRATTRTVHEQTPRKRGAPPRPRPTVAEASARVVVLRKGGGPVTIEEDDPDTDAAVQEADEDYEGEQEEEEESKSGSDGDDNDDGDEPPPPPGPPPTSASTLCCAYFFIWTREEEVDIRHSRGYEETEREGEEGSLTDEANTLLIPYSHCTSF
ncbi:hypothetical protein CBR_g26475 [Chara braunii]|uniref:DUF659 domain-containing protein n=1 Tax=Chara braunii TaxID=69332 RepID=A0A388L818_CHABU|nr:hypothetical protein CBR_g26475 [Chara braunii]|eukprot:GBG78446.1 hypothetical protein CBR_g26475 [Chara braunii]